MKTFANDERLAKLAEGSAGVLARETVERMAAAASSDAPARSLAVIGAEIRDHTAQFEYHLRGSIWEAIEIGRRLAEARDICQHGEWMDFLKNETSFSYDKANNLIKVFEGYGNQQKSLFGPELSNFDTYQNLNFSKALALLAIRDEDEREQFTLVHDVENMSTRELRQAIQERDEARAGQRAAEKIAEEAANATAALRKQLEETKHELTGFKAADTNLRNRLEQAAGEAAQLRAQVKELEARPTDVAVMAVDAAALDQARAEGRAELRTALDKAKAAKDKAEEKRKAAETALAEANEKLKAAQTVAAERQEAAMQAEKKAAIAGDADLTRFGLLYNQAVETVNVMRGLLLKVAGREDSAPAEKMKAALGALSEAVKEAAK